MDSVLLLIIGEATQQALLGEDFSLFNAFLVIVTLLGIDLLLSVVQRRFTWLTRYVEGLPVVLVDRGRVIPERMRRGRVSEDDLLEKARTSQGLLRLDQIKYAVLEKDGSISIVPPQRLRRGPGARSGVGPRAPG